MHLQAYKYTIRCQPGVENVADILSQFSSQQPPKGNPGEHHNHHIINKAVTVSIKLSDIITKSAKDEKIKEAIKSLETYQWNKSSPFYKIRDQHPKISY